MLLANIAPSLHRVLKAIASLLEEFAFFFICVSCHSDLGESDSGRRDHMPDTIHRAQRHAGAAERSEGRDALERCAVCVKRWSCYRMCVERVRPDVDAET